MSEVPASPAQKKLRRPKIVKAAVARRKSVAMHALWERRRAEMREFQGDEERAEPQHTESAGSPDADLDELPDVLS